MNIVEFLEARIAEDEERASSGWSTLGSTRWETDNYGRNFLTPSAVLAECAAKRAILSVIPATREERGKAQNQIVEALAAIHRDHPDYQEAWG